MRFFATTPKGLEEILCQELRELGAQNVTADRGGAAFEGDFTLGLRCLLWLRSAMRLLVPIARPFRAATARDLYQGTFAIPGWVDKISPEHTFSIEAHGKTRGLIHTHFTGQTIKDAIVDQIRRDCGARPSVDGSNPDVVVVAHLSDEMATLYVDMAGESLHRRGYRVRQTPATLKESIAAALLLWSGWRGETPLWDPMCGSGTFAIEAALIALQRAPNLGRRFGVERWPSFGSADAALLDQLRAEARGKETLEVPIMASDISPQAIAAAKTNAKAANVSIQFRLEDATKLTPMSPPGLVVTNPPYGERLQDAELQALYQQFAQSLRGLGDHKALVLSGNPALEKSLHMMPKAKKKLWNGPIECTALLYEIWALPQRGNP